MNELKVDRQFALPARGICAAVLAIAALAFAIFAGPAVDRAAASSVQCAGSITPSKTIKSDLDLDYSFFCSEPVLSYTLSFNKQVAVFEPEVLPTLADGSASGELASCEGGLPTFGFGCSAQATTCPSSTSTSVPCTGRILTGNTVKAGFETAKPFCPLKRTKKGPFEAYLTVATLQLTASNKTYVITSAPFHLDRVKCPKPVSERA